MPCQMFCGAVFSVLLEDSSSYSIEGSFKAMKDSVQAREIILLVKPK